MRIVSSRSTSHQHGWTGPLLLLIFAAATTLFAIPKASADDAVLASRNGAASASSDVADPTAAEPAYTFTSNAFPLDGFSLFGLVDSFLGPLGSQRRMLQVATVGMCLALYILMRK